MSKSLPLGKMYRYCMADIAKGLFNGMIGNYLLYFFQPTVSSGLPKILTDHKLLGFITIMALITGISKVVDATKQSPFAGYAQRTADPKEMAAPLIFLNSDMASFVSGTYLFADYGASNQIMNGLKPNPVGESIEANMSRR